MTRLAIVLFGAATLIWQPRDGTPPQRSSTGTIRGRVVAAASGDPIRNARVSVTDDRERPPVLSDADGRFEFPALPPGRFTLTASKAGFAKQAFGARAPGGAGAPIRLAAGTVVDDVVVSLPRGAAIAGIVVDETGEPVAGVSVTIERPGDRGRAAAMPITGITDDSGRYRIGGLDAGSVLVSIYANVHSIVMLPDGGMMSGDDLGQRTYFPGAAKAEDGQPLVLQPGDEKAGIDFVTPAAVPIAVPVAAPPRDATVVSGRIVTIEGRPLPGAQVRLEPAGSTDAPPRLTVSDAEGAYQFALPRDASGTFRVFATGAGYGPAWYGQREDRDAPEEIAVGAGDVKANLDVALARPAAISGRIFDENGDPVEGASVRTSLVRFVDGQWRLVPGPEALRRTDDLGRFRISRLSAGEYIVSASVGQIIGPARRPMEAPIDLPGYAVTYFRGTLNPAETNLFTVRRSEEITGVDISLVRTPMMRVAGQAFDAAGEPATGGITLSPSHRSGPLAPMTLAARIERDGRFEFTNVPPGDYVLQVSRHRTGSWDEGDTASQFVTVTDGDVTGLEVHASSGSTVTGRIVVEGYAPIKATQLELSPLPLDPDQTVMHAGPPARALIGEDLRFELGGLHGPRRLCLLRAPAGFALKAILSKGSDVTDAILAFGRPDQSLDSLEVVLTPHITEIAGSVTDTRGQPFNDAAIFAFPLDPSLRYSLSRFVATAATDHDAKYRLEGLPPGEYYVAAADRRKSVEVPDPEFLESLTADAARVTLAEGQHVPLTLRAR